MLRLLLLFSSLIVGSTLLAQTTITVSNTEPRRDTAGQIIDLHDGRVIRFGERYYWYGTSYGTTTGFTRQNRYHCYSSPDLMTWQPEGPLLPVTAPSGIYYRPHVVYNARTRQYILWYNWYPRLWQGRFGVAVSDTPTGPFRIVNDDVQVAHSQLGVGDFGLFIDDDGTGYISYNTIDGHRASVERLTDDYLGSTLENGGFITEHCEAGSIFRRKNNYYLLTDYTCCFCTQGTGVRVYISDDPLRGYELRGNINRYPGTPAYALTDGRMAPNQYTTLARKDSVFPAIELDYRHSILADAVTVYQFTGNRQGMCGDTTATAVHDSIHLPRFTLEYRVGNRWQPLPAQVAHNSTSVHQRLTYSFTATELSGLRIRPAPNYPYDQLFINEIEVHQGATTLTPAPQQPDAYLNDTDTRWTQPIVPAQQTFVMPLVTAEGTQYIYMGDLWGSALDNVKGHDFQYWSPPLEFTEEGDIRPMRWTDEWQVTIPPR